MASSPPRGWTAWASTRRNSPAEAAAGRSRPRSWRVITTATGAGPASGTPSSAADAHRSRKRSKRPDRFADGVEITVGDLVVSCGPDWVPDPGSLPGGSGDDEAFWGGRGAAGAGNLCQGHPEQVGVVEYVAGDSS